MPSQLVETAFRDILYSLRGFRGRPLFFLTVVGTIALGLGFNAALFTLFSTMVLRPFAVLEPYSLYAFTWTNRAGNPHDFSWRDFESLRQTNPAFSEVLATDSLIGRVSGRLTRGQLVTGNYFRMLGARAHLGRVLGPDDQAAPGQEPVLVLSYGAWKAKFGGDPGIIGKKVLLRGYPLQVVGVASDAFSGLELSSPDFWVPLTIAGQLEDGPARLQVVGRLKPGWTRGHAEAALTVWSKQLTSRLPDAERAAGALLESKATGVPLSRQALLLFSPLMVAFGLVLLLACANVANMMLARAMARQREIGIRLSLGASRRRLIRQFLTESILIAIPAGLAGFIVSRVAVDVGLRIVFATLPPDFAERVTSISMPPDAHVFVFMLIAALVSAVLFGLAPAIQATRPNVMLAARGEFSSDVRPMRLRNALVIGQITICALLLICSAVFIRAARAMRSFDLGFRTHGVIYMEDSGKALPKVLAYFKAAPAVESMAAVSSIPLRSRPPSLTISSGVPRTTVQSWQNHVSPEFFNLLEIPILEGRNFTPDEAKAGAPVAIVSELAARSLWPKGDGVGREIRIQPGPPDEPRLPYSAVRVVGVAGNIITDSIAHGNDPPLVYFPAPLGSHNSLLLKVHGDVETVRRTLLADLDAAFPGAVAEAHPMDSAFTANVFPFRMASWIGSALGGLALLLTLSGIYGVLSYLITQRTKEIGIRMALGATTGAVTRLVLWQSGRLAGIGIGLGTALALGVSRLLTSYLVFVNTFDILAYSGGMFLVAFAALAAAYVPSRRAARIDPLTTLRYD